MKLFKNTLTPVWSYYLNVLTDNRMKSTFFKMPYKVSWDPDTTNSSQPFSLHQTFLPFLSPRTHKIDCLAITCNPASPVSDQSPHVSRTPLPHSPRQHNSNDHLLHCQQKTLVSLLLYCHADSAQHGQPALLGYKHMFIGNLLVSLNLFINLFPPP